MTNLESQVLDQYLSFIAPSPSLFSLVPPLPPPSTTPGASQAPPEPHSTYAVLNTPSSTERQIEDEIERVATGLFSVVATTGESISTMYGEVQ